MLSTVHSRFSITTPGETLNHTRRKPFELHRSIGADEAEALCVGGYSLRMQNTVIGFREIAGGEIAEFFGIGAGQYCGEFAAGMRVAGKRFVLGPANQIGAALAFRLDAKRCEPDAGCKPPATTDVVGA